MMKKCFVSAEAAHLYLMGWMVAEIAKELGVSSRYIEDILERRREEWMQSASKDAFLARAEELARIEALLRMYSMAWVESKGKRTSRSVKYGPGEPPTAEELAGDAEVKQIVDGAKLGSDEILAAAKRAGVDTSIAFGDPSANRGAMAEAAHWRRLANLVATEVTVKTDGKRDGNPAFLAGIQWCIEMRVKILGLSAAQEIKLGGELRVAGATPNEVEQQMLGRLADRLRSMQLPTGN